MFRLLGLLGWAGFLMGRERVGLIPYGQVLTGSPISCYKCSTLSTTKFVLQYNGSATCCLVVRRAILAKNWLYGEGFGLSSLACVQLRRNEHMRPLALAFAPSARYLSSQCLKMWSAIRAMRVIEDDGG